MKKIIYSLSAPIGILALMLYSCTGENTTSIPNASSYSNIKQQAITSSTQHFYFNAQDGYAHFTSSKGVTIDLATTALSLNGNPITSGQIKIEYIEIFDGGGMAATGKHTMGKMPDGKRAMLLSGGEFYISATQNGQQLDLNGSVTLGIPATLTDSTGNGNPDMTLWNLAEQDSVWVPATTDLTAPNGVFLNNGQVNPAENVSYFAYLNHFGWTNVDCFYSDPRPKTTILASVPARYNNQNCDIYLHYDGNGNALAKLDRYDSDTGLFTEHYGQIPIGLACHIIFASESNGQWRYAIKQATITAGAIYNFSLSETTIGTQDQMVAAINALP